MKSTLLLLLFPTFIFSQTTKPISYQEGIDNCHRIIEEKQKQEPGKFFTIYPFCLEGVQMPEFTGTTIDGKAITPEYFKGKITILNFWSISCPPCIAEIPGFNALVDQYGNRDVQFLAIGNDSDDEIKKFVQQNPWKFDQVSNGFPVQMDIFQLRSGYPTTYVINREGTILSTFAGGKPDERAVQEIQDMLNPILEKELHH